MYSTPPPAFGRSGVPGSPADRGADRWLPFFLTAVLAGVVLAVVVPTAVGLYHVALAREQARLADLVRTEADLIDQIAKVERHVAGEDVAADSIFAALQRAHGRFVGLGRTGELVIARREADRILFPLVLSNDGVRRPPAVAWESRVAGPARRGLNGETGSGIESDFRDVRVVAAYRPLSQLAGAVVVKIDLAEVRAPYVRAGMAAGFLAVVFLAFGGWLFWYGTRPLTRLLRNQAAWTNFALAASEAATWDWSFANDTLAWSPHADQVLGHPAPTTAAEFYDLIEPDDRAAVRTGVKQAIPEGAAFLARFRVPRPHGSVRHLAARGLVHRDPAGRPLRMAGVCWDVTDLTLAEQRVVGLTRLYRFLSDVNQAIVRVQDRQALFDAICHIAVETGGYRIAGVGLRVPDSPFVRAVASVGIPREAMRDLRVTLEEGPFGQDPVALAMREGQVVAVRDVSHDPRTVAWRPVLEPLGVRAVAAIPVLVEGRAVGVFTVGTADPDAFDTEERVLLGEVGADLSHAMGHLAAQAALRESEERLRESEARFRRLADNVPDVIYRHRIVPTPAFEFVNSAVERLLGYSPGEHYADPDLPTKIVHPEDLTTLTAMREDPDRFAGQPVELRWIRRDGLTRWFEHRNTPVRDAGGRVVALEGIMRDVTERKAFEERLARLSRVVEQTTEAVLITDPNGLITYVNPAFERITGYAAEEAIGQTPRLLKSGRQPLEAYQALWQRVQSGKDWSGTLVNRRKNGTYYVADAVISPIRGADGAVVALVGQQRDVTREGELREQLRQAQKMETVGQLTGGVAHDFNNLLNVVLANTALIESVLGPRHPEAGGYLTEIQTAARRGSEMVRKLLAFSRREQLSRRAVDPLALVRDVLGTLRRTLPASIACELDSATPVPAIFVDPGAVEQILMNLATNARDAMPRGGTMHLSVRPDPAAAGLDAPDVEVMVRDTGDGMDPAVLDHLFEPFFTTKPAGKGTGLGMSMVYGLMQQHGGTVHVTSTPGGGTTVRLRFPRASGAALPEAAHVQSPLRGGSETILLVEDEEALRRAAGRILERFGYHVLRAADGVEALETFRAHRDTIDLVITDVIMPRMGGEELLEALHRERPGLPVFLATGYTQTDLSIPAQAAAGVWFIQKPWTAEDLLTKVREVLDETGAGG